MAPGNLGEAVVEAEGAPSGSATHSPSAASRLQRPETCGLALPSTAVLVRRRTFLFVLIDDHCPVALVCRNWPGL